MIEELNKRIDILATWIFKSKRQVVFTGAGISTDSGIPDFRGPNGLWTRRDKGLPVEWKDFPIAVPNKGHLALFELQKLNKLAFLISQNVDNLHLRSGIRPELLAELHGNITKVRCSQCEFIMDNFDDAMDCPLCGGKMVSSVVNFGQSLPQNVLAKAIQNAQNCDLFVVVGSSLVVYPAADMPRLAVESGARLVIINDGETPLDGLAHLRFHEKIDRVLPASVRHLKKMMGVERIA